MSDRVPLLFIVTIFKQGRFGSQNLQINKMAHKTYITNLINSSTFWIEAKKALSILLHL